MVTGHAATRPRGGRCAACAPGRAHSAQGDPRDPPEPPGTSGQAQPCPRSGPPPGTRRGGIVTWTHAGCHHPSRGPIVVSLSLGPTLGVIITWIHLLILILDGIAHKRHW